MCCWYLVGPAIQTDLSLFVQLDTTCMFNVLKMRRIYGKTHSLLNVQCICEVSSPVNTYVQIQGNTEWHIFFRCITFELGQHKYNDTSRNLTRFWAPVTNQLLSAIVWENLSYDQWSELNNNIVQKNAATLKAKSIFSLTRSIQNQLC